MATGRIHEPARDIDIIHETEILVVGSGPGGLPAALAAARAREAIMAKSVIDAIGDADIIARRRPDHTHAQRKHDGGLRQVPCRRR